MMLGNEAVARGLYEAGCSFVSSYPGTPSTEITECAAEYEEVYAEWAPNEKTALEAAIGASIMGARAFAAMKHVGLNVAADPLYSISYGGVNGGLVVAVADDPGMHSSQNEQDSRRHAIASKVPMLEPSDSAECKEFAKAAFELSEKYNTPVLLRLSTRVSHSQNAVELCERDEYVQKPYVKDAARFVLTPANSQKRHPIVEKRMAEFDAPELDRKIRGGAEIGIVTAGTGFLYAREALGDKASYLKLGVVNPLPVERIREFAKTVKKLYVIEELDPVIETQLRAAGIPVTGGKELFSLTGEYTAAQIREKLLGERAEACEEIAAPPRPPVLCPGCPHRATFYVLKKLKLEVSGDIGCYTLGAAPPLGSVDTTIDMGASVGALHGMLKARPENAKNTVAVIGDSTFIHSGITALINIVYNQSSATVLILDNSITGMTGHQQNPATGLTLKNTPAPALNIPELCRAVGVKRVSVIDPFDMKGLEALVKTELEADEPSVIVVKHPCALLKYVKRRPPLKIDAKKCAKCGLCMKPGCPALSMGEKSAVIDQTLCAGCGLCASLCAKGAIGGNE